MVEAFADLGSGMHFRGCAARKVTCSRSVVRIVMRNHVSLGEADSALGKRRADPRIVQGGVSWCDDQYPLSYLLFR